MTAVAVERPPISFQDIPADSPDLDYLLNRLEQRTTAFRHQSPFTQPRSWFGAVDRSGSVLAALGFDAYGDGTIHIRYALARPSRLGSTLLEAVVDLMDRATKGKRIIFFSQVGNLRMERIAKKFGFRVSAVMCERGGTP